ncbi:MAG: clostripain-related cysteine peptidase [bacterium]
MKTFKRFRFKSFFILFLCFFSDVVFAQNWLLGDRRPNNSVIPIHLGEKAKQNILKRPKLINLQEPKNLNSSEKIQSKEDQRLPEWTMIVYVQANNNLAKYAIKNFEDMSMVGSSDKLKIVVQWYDANHRGIWRYRIDKGQMVLQENKSVNIDGNKSLDLVEAVKWAVEKYPAQKYFLILWNHGVGILDPIWGNTHFSVDKALLEQNPRIQIADLTIKNFDFQSLLESFGEEQRGILFNEASRTYMTNQELKNSLNEIKNTVLKKKIDVIGMDACLMGMIEVGYQIKDYADYFVASEEVELASGWSYSSILRPLTSGGFSSYQLAKSIVENYEKLYNGRISFYTQSAIDLNKISDLKEALDLVVGSLNECRKYNLHTVKSIINKSRSACLHFSTSSYIDLYSFVSELIKNTDIETAKLKSDSNSLSSSLKKSLILLKASSQVAIELMNELVIANSVGTAMKNAGGLSIYYPTGNIDASYQGTDFAKESLWLNFLKELRG